MKKFNNYLLDKQSDLIDKSRMLELQKDSINEDKYVKPLRAGLAGVLLYFFLTLIMLIVSKGLTIPYMGAQALMLAPSLMFSALAIKTSKKNFKFGETFKQLFSAKTKANRLRKELSLSLEQDKVNSHMYIVSDAIKNNDTKSIESTDVSKQISVDKEELGGIYKQIDEAEKPGHILKFFKKHDKKYLKNVELIAASIAMGTMLTLSTNVLTMAPAYISATNSYGSLIFEIITFLVGAGILPAYTISGKLATKQVKEEVGYSSIDPDKNDVDVVDLSKKATELECKLQKEYEIKNSESKTNDSEYYEHSYFEEVVYGHEPKQMKKTTK